MLVWDKSLNACEFKRTKRRGAGDSIADKSEDFFHEREQSKGVGVGRRKIKKEEMIAHLHVDENSFKEREKVLQEWEENCGIDVLE